MVPRVVREYAEEKLVKAGEAAAMRTHHLDWFLGWAERAARELIRHDQAVWYRRLAADNDNLRAALNWSHSDPGGGEKELRLAAALGRFWIVRGRGREGRAWLADALARGSAEATVQRATALAWAGRLETVYGNPIRGRTLCEQGVAVARAVCDPALLAFALSQLGLPVTEQGDLESAMAIMSEAATTARQAGNARETAFAAGRMGYLATLVGDLDVAGPLVDEALTLSRMVGDGGVTAFALLMLGRIAMWHGNGAQAQVLFQESITTARSIGFNHQISNGLNYLGDLARSEGDRAAARAAYREGLAEARATGAGIPIATGLLGLDAETGRCARAARLLAAEEAWRENTGNRRPSWRAEEFERALAGARSGLAAQDFADARAAGRAMTLDQAVADALDDAHMEWAVGSAGTPAGGG